MLEYHAAYFEGEDGWIVAEILDFPGALSQGKTLQSARKMLRDALRVMAQTLIEDGQSLPRPNPRAKDKKGSFSGANSFDCPDSVRGQIVKRRAFLRFLQSANCQIIEGSRHTRVFIPQAGNGVPFRGTQRLIRSWFARFASHWRLRHLAKRDLA